MQRRCKKFAGRRNRRVKLIFSCFTSDSSLQRARFLASPTQQLIYIIYRCSKRHFFMFLQGWLSRRESFYRRDVTAAGIKSGKQSSLDSNAKRFCIVIGNNRSIMPTFTPGSCAHKPTSPVIGDLLNPLNEINSNNNRKAHREWL